MTFRQYIGDDADLIDEIVTEHGLEKNKGKGYWAGEDLETSVNVALALGRPLLVTGEPGVGKTHLGFSIARRLGISQVLTFTSKSNSQARDLFYQYDALGRFQAAQVYASELGAAAPSERPKPPSAADFIEYAALGRAILDAHAPEEVAHLAAGSYRHPGQARRSVIIVDEVDKAPRDFPNDLLIEIESLAFQVPELASKTREKAPGISPGVIKRRERPIVIITSNSERQLPDAFLRRCVFHHIEFPASASVLHKIIIDRLGADAPHDALISDAVELVTRLRRSSQMEKLPATDELIAFVSACAAIGGDFKAAARQARSALGKSARDQKTVETAIGDAPRVPEGGGSA